MATYIVETTSGHHLLVNGADDAYSAIRIASSYASTHGVPLSARPTNPDSIDEPEISLYVCSGR
jgi:hypothetical protein